MRKIVIIPLFVIAVLFLSACMPIQDPAATQAEEVPQPAPMSIERASDVPRITLEEAKEHFENGTAIFVDSRDQTDYDVEHIAGALARPTVPLSELGDTMPKDQLIITYCT